MLQTMDLRPELSDLPRLTVTVAEPGPSQPKPLFNSSDSRRSRYLLDIGMPLISRSTNKLSDLLKTLGQGLRGPTMTPCM